MQLLTLTVLLSLQVQYILGSCPNAQFTQVSSWCYNVAEGTPDYNQALLTCAAINPPGVVVTVMSSDEQAFLNGKYSDVKYWLGLTKVGGVWTWADGSPLNFTSWAPGQPSGTGTCVLANNPSLGFWSAVDCSLRNTGQASVCKLPATADSTVAAATTTTTITATTTIGVTKTTTQPASMTTTTAPQSGCTSTLQCDWTQLCSNGVCVETTELTPCVSSSTCSGGVCESGYCVYSGTTTTTTTTTTAPPAPMCKTKLECGFTQLCSNGVCVETTDLLPCKNGTCAPGKCENNFCVDDKPTTTTTTTTAAPPKCTTHDDCNWTDFCTNGVCVDANDVPLCASGTCPSGVCYLGHCINGVTTTTTTTTTTRPQIQCTIDNDCHWSELCHKGICTKIAELPPCDSNGNCEAGRCEFDVCVEKECTTYFDCHWSELCHKGICTKITQLPPCESNGNCAAGRCELGVCVENV